MQRPDREGAKAIYRIYLGTDFPLDGTVDELADDKGDAVKIAKVNVDENQRTAQSYRAMSIPMMVIMMRPMA